MGWAGGGNSKKSVVTRRMYVVYGCRSIGVQMKIEARGKTETYMVAAQTSKNKFIGVRNLGRYLLHCSGIWICILREMVNIKHARVRVYNVITMKNLGVILTVKWVVHSSSNSSKNNIHVMFQREYGSYNVVGVWWSNKQRWFNVLSSSLNSEQVQRWTGRTRTYTKWLTAWEWERERNTRFTHVYLHFSSSSYSRCSRAIFF